MKIKRKDITFYMVSTDPENNNFVRFHIDPEALEGARDHVLAAKPLLDERLFISLDPTSHINFEVKRDKFTISIEEDDNFMSQLRMIFTDNAIELIKDVVEIIDTHY